MEMTQEWIAQYNQKCAEFLGWKETTDEFKIEWTGCKTKDKLDRIDKNYIPILEKNGDVLFPDFSVMDFTKDWNWIMEVVDKIQYYRACILSKNHCEIHMMPTDSVTSINIGAISSQLATVQAIDQFIDWYNKQKES